MSFGKKSVFGGGGGGGFTTPGVALNLTALMDILSNILFFLLAAYAAQATEVEDKSGMQLPASSSQTRLQLQLTVSISKHAVQVADATVAYIKNGRLVEAEDEEGKIPAIYQKLAEIRDRRENSGRALTSEGTGILLLADKDTDSDTVNKVLKTAGHAGFVNVRFGVIAR